MPFRDVLVVVRGGGDLGTGVCWRLTRAGFPVVVAELPAPLSVRRSAALSSAVHRGTAEVEGMCGVRSTVEEAAGLARSGVVPVVVTAVLPPLGAAVVVDARMAKRPLDTTIGDADLVVGLGPGFTAGHHCHAVVETLRGPRLGRALWQGSAAADTGLPGELGGRSGERVLRAPVAGAARWRVAVGDVVEPGDRLGSVGGVDLRAPFRGRIRGLIADGTEVPSGLKVGDLDPRLDTPWREISDKALAVGGGVLEAVLTWWHDRD
jgi:xanthine dehydrogenase accessory factor